MPHRRAHRSPTKTTSAAEEPEDATGEENGAEGPREPEDEEVGNGGGTETKEMGGDIEEDPEERGEGETCGA
jgi:hypothetical protein